MGCDTEELCLPCFLMDCPDYPGCARDDFEWTVSADKVFGRHLREKPDAMKVLRLRTREDVQERIHNSKLHGCPRAHGRDGKSKDVPLKIHEGSLWITVVVACSDYEPGYEYRWHVVNFTDIGSSAISAEG